MSAVRPEATLTTRAIHGDRKMEAHGAVTTPIYQSSTFEFESAEQGGRRFAGAEGGYIYTRLGNPTTTHLENLLAGLEHSEACAVTASGMGAIASTVLTLLSSGDHIITDTALYGCTDALFRHSLTRFGIEVTFIDASVPGSVKAALKSNTKIVYFETPSNPFLKILDIEAIVAEARTQDGILVVCDNTFATPVAQQPITLGVDVVVHSLTKALNGHADVIGGCVCASSEIIQKIKMIGMKDVTGSIISPNDAFLVTRGLMTLELRVKAAAENAMKCAKFLEAHPAVEKVHYPGLESHPGHAIAKKQMSNFGSMITFELKAGLEGGIKMINNVKTIILAVSLGGCASLIQHPASMTHSVVPREERLASGLTDGMIRFSVGIEGSDDIIADLKQALESLA